MIDTATTTKNRYNDEDLNDFKLIIQQKITAAREELAELIESLQYINPNGIDDTSSSYNTLEDGAATLEKETLHQMASRQKKFIEQLEAALNRINNKTYGICRVTGKLIPRERLVAVPHTTLCMEAKLKQG
jgi:DnaK suppressor protein